MNPHWIKLGEDKTEYLEIAGDWCESCKDYHGRWAGHIAPYTRKGKTLWFAKVDKEDHGMRGFKTEDDAKAYVVALARMS